MDVCVMLLDFCLSGPYRGGYNTEVEYPFIGKDV